MDRRFPPDDPREWLARARLNLTLARQTALVGSRREELAFNAQQAAEKAIKAVFLSLGVNFPYTHNIRELLDLLERKSGPVPDAVRMAERLTQYVTAGRYPGDLEPVTAVEHDEAVHLAEAVLAWAEELALSDKRKK